MTLTGILVIVAVLIVVGVIWAIADIWLLKKLKPEIHTTITLLICLMVFLYLLYALFGVTLPGLRQ